MSTMTTVTDVLAAFGATDSAIAVMGPTLTAVLAWVGGMAVAQLAKFPLARVVSGDWHGYLVRLIGASGAFSFAHWLSNHLSVPLEVLVGVSEPIVYAILLAAATRYAPWLANSLLRTVHKDAP
jgi:hypothetical protein